VPPRDEMEASLKSIWEKTLKISPLSVRDNFFELGGHSFLAAKLFAETEKRLGKRVPLSMLIENPTIETLANCIRQQELSQRWPGVIRIHAEGNRPPLFIAHGLGGSLLIFRALAERLGPDQPVYGLQIAPGMMEHKDELSIPELASIYVDKIKSVCPSGPYHIGGHSMGGLIAYEIANQLSQMGEEVGLLALFDCDLHTSGFAASSSISFWRAAKIGVLRSVSMFQRASGAKRNQLIQRKIFYEKLRLQITLLKHFPKIGDLFPKYFGEDVYVALSTQQYNPQSYSGNAVVFLAADQLRANRNFGSGWAQVVLGNLEIQKIPGTHQSMFTPPYVDLLAQEVMRRLQLNNDARARRNRPALTGS
jgi:thioesterase domain-containing protein/acyl carrier protein